MWNRLLLGLAAVVLVIAAAYAAFYVAPEERTMGLIQRIFYLHVASAWAGLPGIRCTRKNVTVTTPSSWLI